MEIGEGQQYLLRLPEMVLEVTTAVEGTVRRSGICC